MEPMLTHEVSGLASEITSSVHDETPKSDHHDPISLPDYSNLLGEEFQIPCDSWDLTYLNVLDSAAIEEGLVHVLYASASQVCYMKSGLSCIAPEVVIFLSSKSF